jgi:archaetidylinositol phosphate synthase
VSNADSVSLERAIAVGARTHRESFKSPDRVQTNILADHERTLLNRLCQRLPKWVTPDHLTAVGMIGAAIAGLGYLASNLRPEFLFLASSGLVVNWFGDSLDGSLARYRGIERPRYGYFVDHSTDALSNLIFALGLGFSPYVSMDSALFLLCGYYLISIQVFLSVKADLEFNLAYMYLGPTELRIIAIVFNFVIYFTGPVYFSAVGFRISLYSLLVALEAIAFVAVFIADVCVTAHKLKHQDESATDNAAGFNGSGQK